MKRYLLALLGPLVFPLIGGNALSASETCQAARSKCLYRNNCAGALRSYMVDCADVLAGRTSNCPWACKRALILLTSSEVGFRLSTCQCEENDQFCRRSKERAEVCRPEVTRATDGETIVPCSVAQWICQADPLCSTALEYYHMFCRPLFHGRKCTPRCNNSVAILNRQEKAAKLRTCYCDGSEDFPCLSIRKNTQRLCFGREDWVQEPIPTTPAATTPTPSCAGSSGKTGNSFILILLSALAFLLLGHQTVAGNSQQWLEHPASSTVLSLNRTDKQRKRCKTIVNHKSVLWPWWWMSESNA